MGEPRWVEVPLVIQIQRRQLADTGGPEGILDEGRLHSAVAQPKSGWDGVLAHPRLCDQAAAYVYHICMNHPFLDANKRTSVATALTFLELNGVATQAPDMWRFADTVNAVATEGLPIEMAKAKIAEQIIEVYGKATLLNFNES